MASRKVSLLGIPPEVRAIIIDLVPHIPSPAPRHPTSLRDQKRRVIERSESGAWSQESRVFFEQTPVPNPVLGLLLTNRQLHDETRAMLKRSFSFDTKPARLPSYTLDVVYLKDCTLWSTWLSVPARAPHVDTVFTQFRLFNCPDGMRIATDTKRDMFQIGCGGPPPIMWPLYHLLICAPKFGPCGCAFTMRRLVIDFLPAEEDDLLPLGLTTITRYDDNTPVDWFEVSLGGSWTPPSADRRLKGPALMMEFVKAQIRRLMWMEHTEFELAKKMYESIGEIELRLAGEVCTNLDLAESLASLNGWGDPGSSRQRKWETQFVQWRPWVMARRRELGMPVQEVVPQVDQDIQVMTDGDGSDKSVEFDESDGSGQSDYCDP
ncbi:hypothetical protein B0H66DRAFT_568351 [Apodospora peruviana]|uniref:Uncharacterized protein n=1 Tax=Apodospora peruviana TaxID=516989 RepID=A0AAE0M199_9PEZI|nr:hypothetical protein B0H66DRAFT_568351 [Apodospora peruviana]